MHGKNSPAGSIANHTDLFTDGGDLNYALGRDGFYASASRDIATATATNMIQ